MEDKEKEESEARKIAYNSSCWIHYLGNGVAGGKGGEGRKDRLEKRSTINGADLHSVERVVRTKATVEKLECS